MYKNLRVVPQLIFGRGSLGQLGDVLSRRCTDAGSPVIFLIDDVHEEKPWVRTLPARAHDLMIFVNCDVEPKTRYVDELSQRVKQFSNRRAEAIVGIGGGSTMDLAKAVSLLLTNPGSAVEYQGWDLVKYPGIYKVGIPTLAGTGAEVSRTTVLTGPVRKLGINSDFTPFDQIVMDPDLIGDAPRDQRFFTGMDSYIHAVESLRGTYLNEFARSLAEKSRDLCRDVFLGDIPDREADEKLMVASYLGGLSIAYSQVGACHALSYGLSFVLGTRHGIGNCLVFDQIEEFYKEDVHEFREMAARQKITLPRNLCAKVTDEQLNEMVRVALSLHPLWENCLGSRWCEIMTPERCRDLYRRM
jgi:3-deoxy-alpha-D-manno-octulosonate 8-oxidase